MVLVESKRNSGICMAHSCNNRSCKKKAQLCHRHYKIRMKKRDPVYVRYNEFKSNAKKRSIEFSVTIQQFRNFCIKNNYIIKKYNRGKNMTIDRRCNVHGYHIWNMQILTMLQNQRKSTKHSGDNFDCPF